MMLIGAPPQDAAKYDGDQSEPPQMNPRPLGRGGCQKMRNTMTNNTMVSVITRMAYNELEKAIEKLIDERNSLKEENKNLKEHVKILESKIRLRSIIRR